MTSRFSVDTNVRNFHYLSIFFISTVWFYISMQKSISEEKAWIVEIWHFQQFWLLPQTRIVHRRISPRLIHWLDINESYGHQKGAVALWKLSKYKGNQIAGSTETQNSYHCDCATTLYILDYWLSMIFPFVAKDDGIFHLFFAIEIFETNDYCEAKCRAFCFGRFLNHTKMKKKLLE